jgi:hypothetical protein
MKTFLLLTLAGAVALAACEGRNPAPMLEAPTAKAVVEADLPDEKNPKIVPEFPGLELFDSDTGFSILDTGPQDAVTGLAPPKFAVHCDTASKSMRVVAPARQLGPYAVAGPAQFVVSGQTFTGDAVLTDTDGASVSMTLPLTPELLAAVATTITARLVIGEGFAESNSDSNGALPGFAGQCSLKSGVPLPAP